MIKAFRNFQAAENQGKGTPLSSLSPPWHYSPLLLQGEEKVTTPHHRRPCMWAHLPSNLGRFHRFLEPDFSVATQAWRGCLRELLKNRSRSGYTPKGVKAGTWRDTSTPMFTTAKRWKQLKWPSTDEWIHEMWYIYTMEYYSVLKGREFWCVLQHWWTLKTC